MTFSETKIETAPDAVPEQRSRTIFEGFGVFDVMSTVADAGSLRAPQLAPIVPFSILMVNIDDHL